jgi:hypothetical protein
MAVPLVVGGVTGTIVQSIIARMFTRKGRQTQIEGLHHGGVAERRRKQTTDFGSGYKDISNRRFNYGTYTFPDSFERYMNVEAFFLPPNRLSAIVAKNTSPDAEDLATLGWKGFKKTKRALRKGLKLYQKTGIIPVFVSESVPDKIVAARHEMIHAAHFSNPTNPFFQEKIAQTERLNQIIPKHDIVMRQGYARQIRTSEDVSRRFMRDTERLAWSFQTDTSFLSQAEAAGIRTHLSLQNKLSKTIMKTGEGAAIGKAGIAEVPAVLKATARVIKNAL